MESLGKVLRLYPLPSEELDAEEVYSDLALPDPVERGDGSAVRPYVVLNMVSTLDGRVSVDGKASPIGGAVDRLLMRNIRCAVDAVMVGAGTLRSEEINLGVPKALSEVRAAKGLPDQPLAVILAGSLDLPLHRRVFRASANEFVVFAGEAAPERTLREASDLGFRVYASRGSRYPEPAMVLRTLREDLGVRRLLVEGGPTVNGALLSSGLVDELFLTLSPKISGSDGAPLAVFETPPEPFVGMKPASVYSSFHEGELYLRYTLERPIDFR